MDIPMNQTSKENMYKLLRELGDVKGTARVTILCLNAFIDSIRQLKCSRGEFDDLYKELVETIKKSKPNIIPLIHLMEYFELDMERSLKPGMTIEEVKKLAIQFINDRIRQFERNASRVTENGLAYVGNGDVIVVHSASAVVTNILVGAKEKLNRKFKVIILDLYPERTRQTAEVLRKADIDHTIIPNHNLSHHIEKATKMFVGAMTITKDRKIVAPVGTAGTVSLCRLNGVKVHLFANTLHYSHRNFVEQNIFQVEEVTRFGNNDLSMTTHSHDLVSLNFIDHIIAEIGEVSYEGYLINVPDQKMIDAQAADMGEYLVSSSISASSSPEMSPA